ncbi:MAG: flavodoxin family protein [Patescibacteria group bacterium]
MKILLISGSPRKGNSEFILSKIFDSIKTPSKELVSLRKLKIKRCGGCLYCEENSVCHVQDDMQKIYEKMKEAEVFVLAVPNYYDNVPGLFKDFIDRLNPFYDTLSIAGKKVINIVTGGSSEEKSRRMIDGPLSFFEELQKLETLETYYFEALKSDGVENNPIYLSKIDEIVAKIDSL